VTIAADQLPLVVVFAVDRTVAAATAGVVVAVVFVAVAEAAAVAVGATLAVDETATDVDGVAAVAIIAPVINVMPATADAPVMRRARRAGCGRRRRSRRNMCM